MFQRVILSKSALHFFFCEAVSSETSENAFDVNGAYIPVCSFQESLKGTLFSINDHLLKAFTTNGVMVQMSEVTGRKVSNRGISNTIESIIRFVRKSKALPKSFQRKCNEVLSSNKKKCKRLSLSNSLL